MLLFVQNSNFLSLFGLCYFNYDTSIIFVLFILNKICDKKILPPFFLLTISIEVVLIFHTAGFITL